MAIVGLGLEAPVSNMDLTTLKVSRIDSSLTHKLNPRVISTGFKGKPYENCKPLGMALIIQDNNLKYIREESNGGYFTFTFARPVTVKKVVMISSRNPMLKVRY